jgi:hypothetical protein
VQGRERTAQGKMTEGKAEPLEEGEAEPLENEVLQGDLFLGAPHAAQQEHVQGKERTEQGKMTEGEAEPLEEEVSQGGLFLGSQVTQPEHMQGARGVSRGR